MSQKAIISPDVLRKKIYTIRGMEVMRDNELAELYGVETKALNQAVKRNIDRFPQAFRFQLTEKEHESLQSQIVTAKDNRGGRRTLPWVFTEQGVAMLSAVLRSERAVQISITIMQAFVKMRHFINTNAAIFQRLDSLELEQLATARRMDAIFRAMEQTNTIPRQHVFFDGQVYDAHNLVAKLIKSARDRLVLIDNYIDESSLTLIGKKKRATHCILLTKHVDRQLALDIKKFNSQYGNTLEAIAFHKSHDRFLIIDSETVYHIGASLKDLGKKWFAISRLDKGSVSHLLRQIEDAIRIR